MQLYKSQLKYSDLINSYRFDVNCVGAQIYIYISDLWLGSRKFFIPFYNF